MTNSLEKDMVSVVIPTYNRKELLRYAIDSALGQTYTNIEIIVVDDGSTDGTELAIAQWIKNPKIRYFRQDNLGAAAARNRGIKEASGDLIAFLDSDDRWQPWKLELQMHVLRKLPDIGLIFTDFSARKKDKEYESYIKIYYSIFNRLGLRYQDIFSYCSRLDDLIGKNKVFKMDTEIYWGNVFKWIFRGNFIPTLTVLGRKSLFLSIGGMDESLRTGEDSDFYLRFCSKYPVAFINISSAYYSTNSGNQLSSDHYGLMMLENWYRSITNILTNETVFLSNNNYVVKNELSRNTYKLGKAYLLGGRKDICRKYIWSSIRYKNFNIKAIMLLLASCMPIKMLKYMYHNFILPFGEW